MKNRKLLLGWLVVAVLVIAIAGVAAFLVLVPEVTEQLPQGIGSIAVTLSAPSNDAQVPMNQFTTVSAEALGVKPITALELWIDGTPSGTENAPSGSALSQFNAFWTWTPANEGEHTLLVRAIDADHNIGMSNIVRVTASSQQNAELSAVIQTKPGDTVSLVAQEVKADPQDVFDEQEEQPIQGVEDHADKERPVLAFPRLQAKGDEYSCGDEIDDQGATLY